MKSDRWAFFRKRALVPVLAVLVVSGIVFVYKRHILDRVPLRPEILPQEGELFLSDLFVPLIRWKNEDAGIEDLDARDIPEGAYEIRIYSIKSSTRRTDLELVVLTLSNGEIRSTHYPRSTLHSRSNRDAVTTVHPDPSFWNALCRQGMFTLPDYTTIQDYPNVWDGVYYLVELKSGNAYRHYRYLNPSHSDSPEAKSMVRIINLLKAHTTFETISDRRD